MHNIISQFDSGAQKWYQKDPVKYEQSITLVNEYEPTLAQYM